MQNKDNFKFRLGQKSFCDKGYGIIIGRFKNNEDNIYYLHYKNIITNINSIAQFKESELDYPIIINKINITPGVKNNLTVISPNTTGIILNIFKVNNSNIYKIQICSKQKYSNNIIFLSENDI